MDNEPRIARLELTTDPDGHPCWIAMDQDGVDIVDVAWILDPSESTKLAARDYLIRRLQNAGWTIV